MSRRLRRESEREMSRADWIAAWRFVREQWGAINQGDMWGALSSHQLLAASFRWQRDCK